MVSGIRRAPASAGQRRAIRGIATSTPTALTAPATQNGTENAFYTLHIQIKILSKNFVPKVLKLFFNHIGFFKHV